MDEAIPPFHDSAPLAQANVRPTPLARARAIAGIILHRPGSQGYEVEAGPADALDAVDRMITPIIEDFHPDTGYRYQRAKELDAPAVRRAMASAFEEFPYESVELAKESEGLFEMLKLDDREEPTDLAKIDHFVAGYPRNVADGLAEQYSSQNVLTTIRTGQRLLELSDEHADDIAQQASSFKGSVAKLLGAKIPQFIAQEGEGSTEELVGITEQYGFPALEDYVDFKLRYKNGLPPVPFDPEALTGQEVPDSPLVHEDADNSAWIEHSWMGEQQRPAEWGDLGQMAATTDQWDREYGLSICRGEEGEMSVGFMRGTEGSVGNKVEVDRGGDRVFFHSHPTAGSGNGLYAPLISSGDIEATRDFDHGGAYLNIVCASGITLHVDSYPADSEDPHGWVVESGELKGRVISPDGGASTESRAVLKELQDRKEPYAYSIHMGSETLSRKMMFVHIPWSHLAGADTSLEELCFGDGLQKILPSELPSHDNPPQNLHSAIRKVR